jgi:tripartite-type tricarboxylate transporter receptor subunit TctC
VKKTLNETLGMDIAGASPEETQKFIAGEMQRWGKVVKENGVKVD